MRYKHINAFDRRDFEFIWKNWIVTTVDKVESQMDPTFKKCTNFVIRDLNKIKESALCYFVAKRESVKEEYYGVIPDEATGLHLMDFHKLSAVLCRTFIENKVYYFDTVLCEQYIADNNIDRTNTDWYVHNVLVNFRLAFYVSVVFLYNSMLFRLKDENHSLYQKLREKRKLNLYWEDFSNMAEQYEPSSNGSGEFSGKPRQRESFENSLVLDLAKRYIRDHSFDCLMYSISMYQLEKYNELLIECELAQEAKQSLDAQ